MIDKKEKKKKKIKYSLLKYLNFSIFKDQINKILDTTFIEDDQIKFLKAKLLNGQISINNFLKKTVISSSQLKELDKYLSLFDREKINSKYIFYFSKIKEKFINYKKSTSLANLNRNKIRYAIQINVEYSEAKKELSKNKNLSTVKNCWL